MDFVMKILRNKKFCYWCYYWLDIQLGRISGLGLCVYKIFVGKVVGKHHLEGRGDGLMIILKGRV
jgi:hypothetical protein